MSNNKNNKKDFNSDVLSFYIKINQRSDISPVDCNSVRIFRVEHDNIYEQSQTDREIYVPHSS